MTALQVRLATSEDDAAIRALLRRMPMPGQVALALACAPSFFAAIEVQGRDPLVIVGEQNGQIVGTGLLAYRRVYLNGAPVEVGYLSSLRADPSIRNTTALARGYRLLAQLHQQQRRVPFYLSTIMEDNAPAQEILTSGRAGLPHYREIGRYETISIPLLPRKPLPASLRILRGAEVVVDDIIACLNGCGARRQFYPVYTAEDINAPGGLLRGLALEDFRIALSGDQIVGVMACWDQTPFRQHVVAGYGGTLRWLRPGINALASLLRCAPLPDPGQVTPDLLAACIAVKDDDPHVFHSLLRHVLAEQGGTKRSVLSVGMAANDPLLPVVREPFHLTLRSRIYAVAWEANVEFDALDGRIPYLELGSL